jgi:hypothetical protein
MRALAFSSFAIASLLAIVGCATFDAPPDPRLVGVKGGLLSNDKAPLVVDFGREVEPKTLKLEVIPYVVDNEGNLADEGGNKGDITLNEFFAHNPNFGDIGGMGTFTHENSAYSIALNAPLPIGPRLAVLVEPGFASLDGATDNVRRRLVFGYQVELSCNKPSELFHSGYYFFLARVKVPIATQVQLYASIDVDKASGAFVGQFTNADRNRTRKCPELHCMSNEVCRDLPSPRCALPSDPADNVDEYSDYVPNNAPPTGYSFAARGCIVDGPGGVISFETLPVDVHVTQPVVTLRNARLSASFKSVDSVLRATGSLSADDVLVGTSASGAASADLTARSLTDEEAPPNIPNPPKD